MKRFVSTVAAILLGLLLWAQSAHAAIVCVQGGSGCTNTTPVEVTWSGGSSNPETTNNFGASVTSGNYSLVFIRCSGGSGPVVVTVTDTLSTSYTGGGAVVSNTTQDPQLWIYQGKLASSGTNAVSVTWTGGCDYGFVSALEVSGLASSSVVDTTCNNASGTGTDLTCSGITTAQADEFVAMSASVCCAFDTSPGTGGWTLVSTYGGRGLLQYQILASTWSSVTAHATAASSQSRWTTLVATFKGDGGGAPAATPCIIGGGLVSSKCPGGDAAGGVQ